MERKGAEDTSTTKSDASPPRTKEAGAGVQTRGGAKKQRQTTLFDYRGGQKDKSASSGSDLAALPVDVADTTQEQQPRSSNRVVLVPVEARGETKASSKKRSTPPRNRKQTTLDKFLPQHSARAEKLRRQLEQPGAGCFTPKSAQVEEVTADTSTRESAEVKTQNTGDYKLSNSVTKSQAVAAGPKQDPLSKSVRACASDGRCYFSYAQISETVSSTVPRVREFNPDVMVAIGGGGFIPARMLRTEVKVPILAVSLELYDDATCTANSSVVRKQWFDETPGTFGALVRGKRVLIVDEVDDTRTTLQFCVEELRRTNGPAAIAVLVVHNKLKEKKGSLPDDVVYIAGEDVEDFWNCYPWDARAYGRDIAEHEKLAQACAKGVSADASTAASPSADGGRADSSTAATGKRSIQGYTPSVGVAAAGAAIALIIGVAIGSRIRTARS